MPHYFFNIRDREVMPDHIGTDLPDLQAARREALRTAGQSLADNANQLVHAPEWSMEVADESGTILFRIDVKMTDTSQVESMQSDSSLLSPQAVQGQLRSAKCHEGRI